jgi:hypothetical protein
MQAISLDELRWIHDCTLLKIVYDASSSDGRSVTMSILCPRDLGYEPWNGRHLTLVSTKLAMAKQLVWCTAGVETIDAIRPGISRETRQSIEEAQKRGARFPELELTISFHSGSTLELICQGMEFVIDS